MVRPKQFKLLRAFLIRKNTPGSLILIKTGGIYMKLEKLVGERFKERPSDCIIDSHALMVRGAYIKYVANGIYSSYTPLKRITKKI